MYFNFFIHNLALWNRSQSFLLFDSIDKKMLLAYYNSLYIRFGLLEEPILRYPFYSWTNMHFVILHCFSLSINKRIQPLDLNPIEGGMVIIILQLCVHLELVSIWTWPYLSINRIYHLITKKPQKEFILWMDDWNWPRPWFCIEDPK